MNLSDIEFGKTRVTHTNFDSGEGTVIAEAPRLYSEGEDRVSVKWDTPARHLTNIPATHQVSYLEAVPPAAPLDPSKVKAGDYIEAESDGTGIKGPVSHINANGYVSIQHLGAFAIEGITTRGTGYRLFTLTAHQPAPEPEPEWKPGTVAEGTVNGTIVRGLIGRDDNGTGDVFTYWNEFARHMSITGHVPDDVRPLVVIDTDVVDELVDSLSHALGERLPPDAVAYISRTDGNNDRRKWVRGLLSHAQPNLIRSPLQILGLAE